MADTLPRLADVPDSATAREVASQPDVWRRTLTLPDEELAVLPPAGEAVLGLGAGTSYYVMDSYARRRQELGAGLTRAAIASELDDQGAYDRVLYLSRSGTTSDVLALHPRFAGRVPTTALSGTPGSPIVEAADGVLLLPFADERSVVQTRFATSALVALRRSLGEALDQLPAEGEAALADELPTEPGRHDHVVFLGTGWTLGLAHEAALKLREAARVQTEAYAVGEYRHGPIAVAGEDSLVWSLAPLPDDVRAAVEATGATLALAERDPLAELVRVHRVALQIAAARGLDPDAPAHLSRSVVLP